MIKIHIWASGAIVALAVAVAQAAPPQESYSPWVYFGEAWLLTTYKITKVAQPIQVLFLPPTADCVAIGRTTADALMQEHTPLGCHSNACMPLYFATCTRITVGNGGIGQIGR